MWIRSQNKGSLINTNEIGILKLGNMYGILSGELILGNYSSKEKAVKVLDMIQDFEIRHQANLLLAIYREANGNAEENMVFQMPQDSEVEV